MGKLTRRGSLAVTAALAVVLAGASGASAADKVDRLGGLDRIDTAIATSKDMYPDTDANDSAVKYVVVARYDDYADALASTPLAEAASNAPILLTQPGKGLDSRVLDEVKRLNAENGNTTLRVIIAGSEGVVSAAAEKDLVSAVGTENVFRAGGVDRYETATKIANVIKSGKVGAATLADFNAVSAPKVYLARGDDFADALAAGAAAAQNDGVVLLTKGNGLEFFTQDYFNNNAPAAANVVAVGGQAAAAAGAKAKTKRVGLDRYETAKLVADNEFTGRDTAALASGQNFPDAVVAGAWAAKNDAPVLLTPKASTSPFTTVYLTANNAADVTIFGDEGAVTKGVGDAVKATLTAITVPTAAFTASTADNARTIEVTSANNAQLSIATKDGKVVASRQADSDGTTTVTFAGAAAGGEWLILTSTQSNGAVAAIEVQAPVVLSADAATVKAEAATKAITGKATPGASVTIAGANVGWTKNATVTANASGVFSFPVTDTANAPIAAGSYTISAKLTGAPDAFPVTVTAEAPAAADAK
ncbi:cell wall-binding repeat-containing protein [Georgenia ruanii]|nr:cell wall-binding repeat-containing protein [Georgenia ruanii]MPV87646.1 hypothetical protein [Georgenia ruanii]